MLQGVPEDTKGYKRLQGITEGCRGLPGVTWCYRGLQRGSKGTGK